MAGPDVSAIAADLARAVELTMSSTASQSDRLKAYNACESFKETSPLCAEAGLYLAAGTQHSIVSRHFGLQLMEHTVKYRWTQISQQEKIFIKENAMKLLAAGGISEEPHMKDALSRVVVEMVKREWPQQWSSLLSELSEACGCGEVQTELVLMVFLRLVEDVALLQTLESNQRRKDIYQALTTNMAVIFEFFLRLIELHVGQFRICTESGDQGKATSHGRVVQVVLLTLTGFVEWVSMSHIMAHNGRLLQILCLLLNDQSFQCAAAECLSQIVNRKGKLEERKPLLILFNDEPIQCLVNAAKIPTNLDEQHYLFKKKLIQVLGGLTTQLCSLCGKDDVTRPNNFLAFLDAIMAFSIHPSLSLSHLVNPLWYSMMKHEIISRDSLFISRIPEWLQCTAPKLVKIIYPTNKNGGNSLDTASFAKIEFDSEEEYSTFFYRCRSDFLESIRQATVITPLVTFSYVEQWLIKCLQVPNLSFGISQNDPAYLEWEALACLTESVLNRVLQAQERPSVSSGLRLLQLCVVYQPVDPLILSTLLTCISALFVFLSMSSGQMAQSVNPVAISGAVLLPQVLEKIFSALVFSPTGQSKDTRSRAVKNVRRHAASLMVKIGNKYPLLLLPVFDQIRATVENLSQHGGPAELSLLEKVTLQEALLLISNHFCDYDRQSTFIGEVMHSANLQWISIANSGAFKGAHDFMAFVGLNEPPIINNNCGQNRSNLLSCVNLLLGAVKRCNWPEDPERATRGGFVVALTESGNPICRNPAAPHVVPLLPHVLSLIRIFNELFTPEALETLNKNYFGCLNMSELEKANLLGIVVHATDSNEGQINQNPLERMQRFLIGLQESCFHLMGSVGPSLGRDLYSLPDLGPAIISSILACLQYIPDHRLRPIIRVFLKPFIYSCPPPFYEVVILPIMAHITPLMASRLHSKWQQIKEFGGKDVSDDNADAQEVLEDILTRALTREYLDLLKVALVGGSLTPESSQDTMETEDLSTDSPTPLTRNSLASEVISELGTILLRSEKTCQSLVLTVLGALSWIDSNASLKATYLIGPILRLLVLDNSLNGDMAAHIMAAVLNGLTLHGQHEANQGSLLTLGAQIYEMLRPTFPEVFAIMQQIPGINPVDLQKLDERISGQTSKGNKVEKVKKDLFKKITSNLIGRSVGQLFKKEIKTQDLPKLTFPKKAEKKEIVPNLNDIFNT